MRNNDLLYQYEKLLLGKNKSFSTKSMTDSMPEDYPIHVLRYAFLRVLEWNPMTTDLYLNEDIIHAMRLEKPIRKLRLHLPPEIRPDDMHYLASKIFPLELHYSKKNHVRKLYLDAISDHRALNKRIFNGDDGIENFKICFSIAINELFHPAERVDTVHDLYLYFADDEKSKAFLSEVYLLKHTLMIYGTPLDALHDVLPSEQQSVTEYQYARFVRALRDSLKSTSVNKGA